MNALTPELERGWVPQARRDALELLAQLPPGQVLAEGTGVPSLVEGVRWRRPRRPAQRAEVVASVVAEAALLGVVGAGGLTPAGRALLTDADASRVAEVLEPSLPSPLDHVLIQADLTAVAPGPLEPELGHRLATVADVESRGGATVYRFTADSLRRAFDAGWSAAEVQAFLASASRTPVPQALGYLVDDVARRFGTVRVGAATSFLRSDDEHALAAVVHDPRAASLRLRRIAPTVLVSDATVDVLLPRLREMGVAPVAEAADGSVRLARPDAHRARSPRRNPAQPAQDAARSAARVSAVVAAVRAGDATAALRPSATGPGATTPATTLATLREAVDSRSRVWISYVDNHGATVERVVEPVRVEAGVLRARDHRVDGVRTFAVHRIHAAHRVDGQERAGGG